MSKQKEVIRRCYNVVKLDKDIWNYIEGYINSNYKKVSVTIVRDESIDVIDGMTLAYNVICEHSYEIKSIDVFATNNNETFEMKFRTIRGRPKYSMCIKVVCKDSDTANEVRILADNLMIKTQASHNLIRISSIIFFYLIIYSLMVLLKLNIMSKWIVYSMFFTVSAAAMLIDIYIYNPLMEDAIYGKRRVQFWVDEESIVRYKKVNRRSAFIGWIFVAISLIVLAIVRL